MSRDELNVDPTEGEFFKVEGLAESIGREGGQNTLDARAGSDPVSIHITFSGEEYALPPDRWHRYTEGLWEHLESDKVKLPDPPGEDEAMDFVVFEDFGTRGLRGDPEQERDHDRNDPEEPRNDFYYFWRNRGRSSKGDTDRGRWGVGKTVFPAASRINAFWGLTVRDPESPPLLMGQAVLKVHGLSSEDTNYAPFGHYGTFGQDSFPFPDTDRSSTSLFSSDFRLKRSGQPGLSVVIPFPEGDLNPEIMARSMVSHYFHPILAGEMVVTISVGDDERFKLDSASLDEAVGQLWLQGDEGRGYRRLFDFVRWSLRVPEAEFVSLELVGEDKAPGWDTGLFREEEVGALQDRYMRGERLAIQIPVVVKPLDRDPELCYFDAFLQRTDESSFGNEYYIRQGLTIPDIRRLGRSGVRGLLVVKDTVLSALIGDSENPAHTDWLERSDRVRRGYRHGATTIRFVRNALRSLAALLEPPLEGEDRDLLSDVFFLETPPEEEPTSPPAPGPDGGDAGDITPEGDNDDTPEPPLPPPPVPVGFRVARMPSGFRITHVPGQPPPAALEIEVAYSTRRANSFSRYQRHDFRLSRLRLTTEGMKQVDMGDNKLVVEVLDEEFMLSVDGFDPNRDLEVRARSIAAPDQDED